jgi:exosortase/archaeosortase family protein
MKSTRKLVALLSALMIVAWLGVNYVRVVDIEEGFIKLVLAVLFGLLLLMRDAGVRIPVSRLALFTAMSSAFLVILAGGIGEAISWPMTFGWIVVLGVGVPLATWMCGRLGRQGPATVAIAGAAIVGVGLLVTGIVFGVRQFEWIGLLFLLYSGLSWALPARLAANVPWMLFFLFWVHPLPWGLYSDFQVFMQRQSVLGSEWILHVLNARVWADDMVLRTAAKDFGVPEACSGMRTATTVLFCVLGSGLLSRLRWFEIVMFLVLGTLQVLVLNIVRITGMVFVSPRMPPGWSDRFLHDTVEVFLLVAVFIIVMEMVLWRRFWYLRWRIRSGQKAGEIERPIAGARFPVVWMRIFKYSGLTLGFLALAGAVGFATYKSRPHHRAEMVRGVIPDLVEKDPAAALRAADRVLGVRPAARDMISIRATALAMLEKYDQAILEYDRIERIEPLNLAETISKGWCLLQLGRTAEAAAVVRTLPPADQERPGVALVLAENAVRENDIDGVVRHIRRAATHPLLVPRVRGLFPYLAYREQWATIAQIDSDMPYPNVDTATLAVLAGIRTRDMRQAERAMNRVLAQWPDSPHLLFPLYELARESGLERWQTQLGELFGRHVRELEPERLDTLCAYFFTLNRIDLAWMAYRRLQDAGASRAVEVARMAGLMSEAWFTAPRRSMGIPAEKPDAKIDLRTLARQGLNMPGFAEFWSRVPLVETFSGRDWRRAAQAHLIRSVEGMRLEIEAHPENRNLRLAYADLLTVIGRFDEAHEQLDVLSRQPEPELVPVLSLRRAFLFHAQQRWVEVFESVRQFDCSGSRPNVRAWLAQIDAAMNLNWSVFALALTERMRSSFPGIPESIPLDVAFWSTFGLYDEALLVIEGREDAIPREVLVRLLYAAGRVTRAKSVAQAFAIPLARVSPERERRLNLPLQAEAVFEPVFSAPLAPAAKVTAAQQVEALLPNDPDSFAGRLGRLMIDWYRASAEGRAEPAIEQWAAAGRDEMEAATALYRLAMLLGQDGRRDEADKTAERALKALPSSPILWRLRVSLSRGEATTARLAFEACPGDSELWLAHLMCRAPDLGDEALAAELGAEAPELNRRTVYTLVRAGDWLLRKEFHKAASILATEALKRAGGFVPAYALAIRSAMQQEQWDDVLAIANEAVTLTDDPGVFYRVVVAVSNLRGSRDSGLRSALEFLSSRYASESIWNEQLGRLYFLTGDTKRAFNILAPLVKSNLGQLHVGSILVGAETARLEGQQGEAIRIMEEALVLHPDNLPLVNNLVYSLAESRDALHQKRALTLIPVLLAAMGDPPVPDVLDTVSLVYARNNDTANALIYSDAAFKAVKDLGETHPFVWVNRAEILMRAGRRSEARELLIELGRFQQLAPDLRRRTRELLNALTDPVRP